MNLLIKSATIVDPHSPFNNQVADVLVENGTIAKIGNGLTFNGQIIDATGMHLLPGFFDLNCNIGELGFETKEDLQTGTAAAAAGGFTGIALMPNSPSPTHSKAEVEYLINRSKNNLIDIIPLGTISYKREGKDMAEMFDMYQSGARAFTDGNRPVQDAGLMERALLYAQGFDALIFSYPEDTAIAGNAKLNEGIVSTMLGMKGIPALAEELMVARDLYLAEYTNSPIHFSTLTTARSVNLLRQAKLQGLKVTCDIAAHHLIFTDEALTGFDSLYKVKPPLRIQADVEALLNGLTDGTIDAIVSQHTPHEVEFKNVEFEVAEFGITGLQTALSTLITAGLSVGQIAEKLSVNPRKIIGAPPACIAENSNANFTLINLSAQWVYNRDTNLSKSANSPFMGQTLTGQVILTVNNNKLFKLK